MSEFLALGDVEMNQDKWCGVGIGTLGGWLLFGAYQKMLIGIREGDSWMSIIDAAFSMHFLAALAAFVAGVAALTELKGGAWFAGIATFIMGVLTISMIYTGVEKSVWQDQIVYLFGLTALFLGILVARGQNYGADQAMEEELVEIAREKAAAQLDLAE